MVFLQNIWWYLVLIGVMILIHELGHYWAARFFDVKVETFSFGFGPRLFGFRRGETDFRFSADSCSAATSRWPANSRATRTPNDPRGFLAKPRWQRMIIAFAGPAMNIVLAVALLTGLFMVHYPKVPNPPIRQSSDMWRRTARPPKRASTKATRWFRSTTRSIPPGKTSPMKEVASAQQPLDVWVERDGRTAAISP